MYCVEKLHFDGKFLSIGTSVFLLMFRMCKLPGIAGKRYKWLKSDRLEHPFYIRKDTKITSFGHFNRHKANGKNKQVSFIALPGLLFFFFNVFRGGK